MTGVERAHLFVHGACADGLTSAGLLVRRYPGARVVYTHPTQLRRDLERVAADPALERLVLADLSPQRDDVEAVATLLGNVRRRAEVAWLDHHAPQWPPEVEARLRAAGVDVVLDRSGTESGASLAARWTGESDPRLLRVADLIRRRDAWTDPHDPDARAWTLVAEHLGEDYVRRLAEGRLDGLDAEGRRLLEAEETRLERALASVRRHAPAVAWLWGEEDISDVADRLFRADERIVFLLRIGPSGRVSVRSRPGRPLAARLAQRMGGGGHDHAAGFDLKLSGPRRWFLRLQKTRHPKARAALEAAASLAEADAPGT